MSKDIRVYFKVKGAIQSKLVSGFGGNVARDLSIKSFQTELRSITGVTTGAILAVVK